jgi:hypothetical protein
MSNWIVDELQSVSLGDERLNKRARSLLETLAADPQASVNAACNGWDETQAAYRFFNNPHAQPEEILQAHARATRRRIEQEPVVLVAQDTTELDYTKHPPKDAGVLNKADRFGLYDHSHIAFTPEKLCLGVLDAEFFDRTPESLGKSQQRASDPIETKESFRWLKGYRLCCRLAAEFPATQIISVADCECDIYDIFLEAEQHDTPADFVIRARVDRSLPERDVEAGNWAYKKVRQEVSNSKRVTTRVVDLPATPKREARTATLEIRAKTVTVKPPHARGYLPEVTYQVVLVEETSGPGDGTDVSWLLITTLPIDSIVGVLKVVETYVARWPIEVYFRVYKTGCRVEDIQLETNDRLKTCLMFYKVVAWRLMFLTFLGRKCPELPADLMFAEAEWKPVWKIVRKTPLPASAPTLGEFIPILARLGGYNARQGDLPPGPQAIWVGIRRMTDFALAWQAFGPEKKKP